MNTFLNPGDVLLTHTPTFDIYGLDAEVLGAKVVTVPDLDGYRRDCDGFLEKVKELAAQGDRSLQSQQSDG